MMKRVAMVLMSFAIILLCGYGLLSGPWRDTGLSRFLHGDLNRSDALAACIGFSDDHVEGTDVPKISSLRTIFDGNGHEWTITGTMSAGDMRGPFECKIGWADGGAAVYANELSLPNGHESQINDRD